MLVIDLKKITPWAAMTNKWTEPGESILANYIDDLEIISIWKSSRRKHWGILTALLGGFLCGSLVPFAGGLFYVDPAHQFRSNSTLTRIIRLSLNDTRNLGYFDPRNPEVQQPISALVGNRRFGALLPVWTSNEYTFEGFNLSDTSRNASISVNTVAFGGTLDCSKINYDAKVTREWYTQRYANDNPRSKLTPGLLTDVDLIPNNEDMVKSGCQMLPDFYPKVTFSRPLDQSVEVLPAAWIDTTNCSNTGEAPLTITTMVLLGSGVNEPATSFNVTGVICWPHFSTRTVEITANASTGKLIDITQSSNTSYSVPGFLEPRLLSAVINRGDAGHLFVKNNYDVINYDSLVPSPDNYWMEYTASRATQYEPFSPTRWIGRDPWFYMLSSGNVTKIREYTTNWEALANDSSRQFGSIMAQLANHGFKAIDSSPAAGSVSRTEPRITVQRNSLRFLQSMLCFLAITLMCCATVFRPKTCLIEDPTTLAALSIVLGSNNDFESQIKDTGHLSDDCFRKKLDGLKIRLDVDHASKPSIMMQSVAVNSKTILIEPAKPRLKFKPIRFYNQQDDEHGSGYRPLMLHLVSRSCLLVAISGTIVLLGILLHYSRNGSGFDASATLTSFAWSYTPNAVLVLLGYAIGGASSSTQALSCYTALQKGSVTGRESLLFNSADHSAVIMLYYSYWQNIGWTFSASSLVTIIYPVIKVTAAGLYMHLVRQHAYTTMVEIDQSLIENLDKLSVTGRNLFNRTTTSVGTVLSDMAIAFTLWTVKPELNFSPSSGTEGPLVFGNLTSTLALSDASQALDHGASLSANVPALQVQVNCSAYSRDDFQVIKEGGVVMITCKTQRCRRYFNFNENAIADGIPADSLAWQGGFKLGRTHPFAYYSFVGSPNKARSNSQDYATAPICGLFVRIVDYGPNITSPTQQFNITPEAIAGYSCVRSLIKVNVNVTFARAVQPSAGGTSLLPANIVNFDEQSIEPANDNLLFKNDGSNSSESCIPPTNHTCELSTAWIAPDNSVMLSKDAASMMGTGFMGAVLAIHPTRPPDSPLNYSLLEKLHDPERLSQAAKKAYIIFSTQYINQLRPLTSQIGNSSVLRTATINKQSVRAIESRSPTIVLMILLSITFVCIIFALWRVPSRPVVAKAPNSIAARASLLAGSRLVRRLREEGVDSVAATDIWEKKVFSMGWWQLYESQPKGEESEERWGIDIGVARLRNTLDK